MENQSCGDTESLIGSPNLNRQNVNDNCNLNIITNIQTNGGSNLNNASSSINEKQTLQNQNQGNNNSKMESNNVVKSSSLSSPQIMSPTSGNFAVDQQVLKVTIHKDANGYGMKVSGDNPVFVESVKTGGAAQKAGLMASDMILKVNGVEVRTQKHTTVVSLIKSSGQVDLTVKRSLKMQRPTSLGIHQQPSFSINNRDRAITAPQPVDNNTQKSVEFNKIRTLQMMLNQELRALEELRSSNSSNDRSERAKIEANIRKLKEQLRQVGGEEGVRQYIPTKIPTMTTPVSNSSFLPTTNLCSTPSPNVNPVQQITTPTSHHTNPALLSLFPRSLSSLSLGTKKLKENDPSPLINNQKTQQNQSSKQQKTTPTKKKKEEIRLAKENAQNLKSRKSETSPPPPLPQRNIPRTQEITINVDCNKRKSKSKTKALSDPKMSTQLFLQVESGTGNDDENDLLMPPPLPPRQVGMMEENKQQDNLNGIPKGRSSQTSLETLLSYTMNPMQQFSSSNKSIGLQKSPQSNSNKHRRVVSSPDNLQQKNDSQLDRHNKPQSNSWELLEKDNATPPGTPPPPYPSSGNLSQMHAGMEEIDNHMFMDQAARFGSPTRQVFANQIQAGAAIPPPETIQKEIMSMEDEDISDDQDVIVDEHGPFNYLQRLLEPENMAHLAVFLNYVISNSDPEPLLFYLITGNLYKEGTVKDMRKWAYEIHSTFLVPNAPLAWFTADENLVREIDNVLQNEYDKAEILRKIFWKSRKKAKEHICEQLIDFQQKRNAGLGTIYGPSDMELNDARGDKVKEQKVFEETLVRKLQIMVDELEKDGPEEDAKKLALSSALSTVLNRLFITRSNPGSPIGKLNNFVSREKSFKKIMGKNRKQSVRGHSFTLHQYYEVTHCNNCHGIIWGISPQGYHCTDCKQNFHRNCLKKLEEDCPGPVPQMRKEHSEKHNDSKISKLIMGKIRSSHHNTSQNERRSMFDKVSVEEAHDTHEISNPTVHEVTDCRPDLINVSVGSSVFTGNLDNSEMGISPLNKTDTNVMDLHRSSKRERQLSNSAPHSVIRSESYKERLSHKRDRNNRRKTSDPSLTKTNDALSGILALERFSASSSSSCGSLSSERDSLHNSPSLSLEQMGAQSQHLHQQLHQGIHQHAHPNHPPPSGFLGQYIDYDYDDDFDDWSSNVDPEILATLSEYEKKRQEIINELYHSERSHNRILRLLDGVFYRPLLESNVLGYDHLQLLFPPVLMQLKELHGSFEAKLKVRRLEDKNVVKCVGDILTEMFEGQSGENLKDYAAQFCSRQQIALKALKERRAKDEHLHRFLTKAESHKACRRLQLQDLLPAVLQRLTKYPLLFENLHKIQSTVYPDEVSEAEAIRKSLESSKRILVDVNQAVKIAEDTYKLETIQRKLDKSSFDKETGNEFKSLDLTKLKLVHDGQLAMKKNPGVPLYGLLFENIMVLLQKHDDKYILKYFPNSTATATNDNSKGISPIIYFDHQTYVRQSAVDKNTFFLLVTKTSQMLELRAPSSSECKAWFKQISGIAEKHTTHTQRSKVHYDVTEDTSTSNAHHSNARDSHESTPEWIASHSNNSGSTNINNNINRSETHSVSGPNLPLGEVPNNDSLSENKSENHPSKEIADKIHFEVETDNEVDEIAVANKHQQNIYENEIEVTLTPQMRSDQSVERLRQLDKIIEDALAEKQKIVCDMYRIPNEHFAAIADIASQPEAPKDSADIILAAFSQVQSLTSILTEYIKKPDNNIVICNKCHLCPPEYKKLDISKKEEIPKISNQDELAGQVDSQNDVYLEQSKNEDTSNADNNESDSQSLSEKSPIPETENTSTKDETTSSTTETKDETDKIIEDTILQEDDGYCEIDRLRLPSSGFIEQPSPNLPEPSRKLCTINANRIPEETEQDIKNTVVEEIVKCEYKNNGAIPKENVNKMSNGNESAIKSSECNTKKLFGPLYKIPIPPLEPSIPCSAIYEIVLALNSQISLLLQKINENDQERDKYRKENNKLREILNQMIEHQRIAVEKIALETKRNDEDRSDSEPPLTKNELKNEEN